MRKDTTARRTVAKSLARALNIYSHVAQRQLEPELCRGAARHIRKVAASGSYDPATLTVCGLSFLREHDPSRAPGTGQSRAGFNHGGVSSSKEFSGCIGQSVAAPGIWGGDRVSHLSLGSGFGGAPSLRYLLRGSERLRTDDSRRGYLDKKQCRRDTDVQAVVSRRHLWLVLNERQRAEHACLHERYIGRPRTAGRRGCHHLSVAAPAGNQGPRPRPHKLLRPAHRYRAVASDHDTHPP